MTDHNRLCGWLAALLRLHNVWKTNGSLSLARKVLLAKKHTAENSKRGWHFRATGIPARHGSKSGMLIVECEGALFYSSPPVTSLEAANLEWRRRFTVALLICSHFDVSYNLGTRKDRSHHIGASSKCHGKHRVKGWYELKWEQIREMLPWELRDSILKDFTLTCDVAKSFRIRPKEEGNVDQSWKCYDLETSTLMQITCQKSIFPCLLKIVIVARSLPACLLIKKN